MSKNVGIIGGGPAGMMAAIYALRAGARVTLLERNNKLGKKLYITGKGRCNVSNAAEGEDFLRNVPRNPRFLYAALNFLSPAGLRDLLSNLGCPTVVERGQRVFPEAQKASEVTKCLTRAILKADVRLETGVESITRIPDGTWEVRLDAGDSLRFDAVVLATGGMSYPATGSDGSGYGLARQAGHRITPLRPSLVRVDCRDPFCADLSGLSLKNVALSLWRQGGKKPLYKELGEMLFTHTGVSGPLVLSASAYMDGAAGDYAMAVDLKPGLTPEQLDARLLRDLDDNKNRDLGNTLRLLLPRAMVPVVLALCAIPPDTKGHQLTRPQRLRLAETVKGFPLHPLSLGPMEEAVVTAGGVALEEVDPKTMASRLVGGLYFAGEMLDLDGYTGGYNLQIAFCTGRAAARGAAAQILLQEEPKNP